MSMMTSLSTNLESPIKPGMDNGKGFYQVFDTPLGSMLVAEQGGELVGVDFVEGVNSLITGTLTEGFHELGTSLLRKTKIQIEEYFDGHRTRFDLPFKHLSEVPAREPPMVL